MAKSALATHDPEILMLNQDYSREQFFEIFPTARTFPQIKIDGESIGGFDQLQKWHDTDWNEK